jgi:hypothetical protein
MSGNDIVFVLKGAENLPHADSKQRKISLNYGGNFLKVYFL